MPQPVFVDNIEEMEAMLKEHTLGYMGTSLNGKPYVVPLNFSYKDGTLTFHCARDGWKLDAIRQNPDVCFAVGWQADDMRRHESHSQCHIDSDSVLCFGTARILEDVAERTSALNEFKNAYMPDRPDISSKEVSSCACVVITLTEMTGRRERDKKRTLWRHVFERHEAASLVTLAECHE